MSICGSHFPFSLKRADGQAHNKAGRLVKVSYGSQTKQLPALLLGRLPVTPNAPTHTETIARHGTERPNVGDSVSQSDFGALSLALHGGVKLLKGELVAVARSFGGFTIGRVEKRVKV